MEVCDEVWENESRMFVSKPWGDPSSIARFTDLFGRQLATLLPPHGPHGGPPTLPVPLGFAVTRDWAVVRLESGLCDELGWSYGMNFKQLQAAYAQSECSGDPRERHWMVRRRRWVRYRKSTEVEAGADIVPGMNGVAILCNGLLGIRIKLASRRYEWKTRHCFLVSQELLSFRSSSSASSSKTPRSPAGKESAPLAAHFPKNSGSDSVRKYSISPKKKVLGAIHGDSSDEDDNTNDGFEDAHEEEEEEDDDEEEEAEEEFPQSAAGASTGANATSSGAQRPVFFYIKNPQIIQPHQIGSLTRKQVKIIKMGRNCSIEDLKQTEKHSGFFALRVWNPMILTKTKYLLNAHTVQLKGNWVKAFSEAISLASTLGTPGLQASSSTSAPHGGTTISARLHLPNLRISTGMMATSRAPSNSTSGIGSTRPKSIIAEQAATAARTRLSLTALGGWGANKTPNAGSISKKRSSGQAPGVAEPQPQPKPSKEAIPEPVISSPSHYRSYSEESGNEGATVKSPEKRGTRNLIPTIGGSPGAPKEKKELSRRSKHSHSVSDDSDHENHQDTSTTHKIKLLKGPHGIGIEVSHLTVCSVYAGDKGPMYTSDGSESRLLPNDILTAINGVAITSVEGLKAELGKVSEGGGIVVTVSRKQASNEHSPKMQRPRSRSSSSTSSLRKPIIGPLGEPLTKAKAKSNNVSDDESIEAPKKLSEAHEHGPTLQPIVEAQGFHQSNFGRKPLQEPPTTILKNGITKGLLRRTIQNHLNESLLSESGDHRPFTTFASLKQMAIKSLFPDDLEAMSNDKAWGCYFRDLIDEIITESGEYKVGGLRRVSQEGAVLSPVIFRAEESEIA